MAKAGLKWPLNPTGGTYSVTPPDSPAHCYISHFTRDALLPRLRNSRLSNKFLFETLLMLPFIGFERHKILGFVILGFANLSVNVTY